MNELLSAEDYLRFPQQEGGFRYAYGAHPLQFAELSLPTSALQLLAAAGASR